MTGERTVEDAARELGSLVTPVVESTPRWIRVRSGGEWVADSRRALLLLQYGPGALPTYYLPVEDVRSDAPLRRDPPPQLPELAGT
jgi:uncharacterized protein (DUF427 family)